MLATDLRVGLDGRWEKKPPMAVVALLRVLHADVDRRLRESQTTDGSRCYVIVRSTDLAGERGLRFWSPAWARDWAVAEGLVDSGGRITGHGVRVLKRELGL